MKTYQVTPANRETYTQSHVKELNANVAISTFPDTNGEQLADLYYNPNGCNIVVFSGSCPPVNSHLIESIKLKF